MKILIVNENYYSGGLDSFLINLINNWPNDHDDIIFSVNQTHPGTEYIREKVKRRELNIRFYSIKTEVELSRMLENKIPRLFSNVLRALLRYPYFIFQIFFFYLFNKKIAPDRILVVNGGYPGGNSCRAAAIGAALATTPKYCIMNCHNSAIRSNFLFFLPEMVIDYLLRLSVGKWITVSIDTDLSFKNRPVLMSLKNRAVIYNGIEDKVLNRSNLDSIRFKFGLSENVKVVLILATYEKRKGHIFLLESFKLLLKDCPDVNLICVGYGYEREIALIKKKIDELGLNQRVQLHQFTNDPSEFYAVADIVVVPSQSFESFGLTIVEAMRFGIPVVATNIGGIPEVLMSGSGGFLSNLDPAEFAFNIASLLNNGRLYSEQSRKGREVFEAKFQASKMAQGYYKCLSN